MSIATVGRAPLNQRPGAAPRRPVRAPTTAAARCWSIAALAAMLLLLVLAPGAAAADVDAAAAEGGATDGADELVSSCLAAWYRALYGECGR